MRPRSILWLAGLVLAIAALAMAVQRFSGSRARAVSEPALATGPRPTSPAPSAALAVPAAARVTIAVEEDPVDRKPLTVDRVPPASATHEQEQAPGATPNDSMVRWRVVDAASGAPIAGATVRAPRVQSDSDGAFELPRTARFARIEAPGYGRRWIEPGTECGGLGRPCLVALERSAILEVHLVDAAGGPAGNAQVSVTSRGDDANQFFLGESQGRDGWSADVRADGACRLELPPREPLYLAIHQPARNVYGWREPALYLDPGEHRVLTRLRDGLVIEGIVVEAGGEPQAKLTVWLTPASASFASDELRLATKEQRAFRAESDLHGRFAFSNVPAGAWRLELPPQQFGHFAQRVTALPLDVQVGLEPVPPLTLTVWRGLYIRGLVLSPDGAPFRAVSPHPCWITASTTGFETRAHVRAGGVFEVGPLVPGSYRVQVSSSAGFAASHLVTARAGDEGVHLSLRLAATLTGIVPDGAGARVELLAVDRAPLTVTADGDGAFRFIELAPGIYDVAAQGPEGAVARLRELQLAPGEHRNVVLRLEPAGTDPGSTR